MNKKELVFGMKKEGIGIGIGIKKDEGRGF
jgi:hypothetical protein